MKVTRAILCYFMHSYSIINLHYSIILKRAMNTVDGSSWHPDGWLLMTL